MGISLRQKRDVKKQNRIKNGEDVGATLEIKFERIAVRASDGLRRNSFPDTEVTVIYAKEVGKTKSNRQ